MNKSFRFLFVTVAVAEIIAQVFHWPTLHFIAKPMIVFSLLIYYWKSTALVYRGFIGALFFCWLGDVFLLFDHLNEFYFMAGLGAFLVAHILLIILYNQLREVQGEGLSGPQKMRASFPIVLMGTGLITILYPTLSALKIPVMVYALVLTIMVLQSIFRYGFTTTSSFWNVLIGALFFMASDSMLAINKFLHPFLYAGILIIVTYMAAVYFIVEGVLAHQSVKT
ncbi:MAG: lysoplasmalogenase [Bacteroidetes bacterium]|nr:lysoplasmalogenase [Bacteroidota bacterium]